MGLIGDYIEVGLNGTNIKHFEDLGYEIPRVKDKWGKIIVPRGTKIKVKIEDLTQYSKATVSLECDCCHKIYDTTYSTYTRYNDNGMIYCNSCASKIKNSGENNYGWNFEKTQEEREKQRNYPEYYNFIKRVLSRDYYTCQCCGKKHNDLEVHHLDGYDWCKEKRTDDTNAITLCHNCHRNFHNIYGMGGNTKKQFNEWIGKVMYLSEYDGEILQTRKVYCYETNTIYSSAKDAASILNFYDHNLIYIACNRKNNCSTAYGYHFLWYDEYINMTSKEIEEYIYSTRPRHRKVICLTTGKIFNQLTDAGEYYGVFQGSIGYCCRGKQKTAGKLPDGTPLQWTYYEDFLKLPIEEQNEILSRNKGSSNGGSFLNCTER